MSENGTAVAVPVFTAEQQEAIRTLARRECRQLIRKEFVGFVRPALTQVQDELRLTLPKAVHPMIGPIIRVAERVMAEFVRNAETER